MIVQICGCTPLQTAAFRAPAAAEPACPHIPGAPDAKPLPPPISTEPQSLQPGHWEWNDGDYVWTPPQWQPRPAAGAPKWRNGYWEASGGACVWHNGRFIAASAGAGTGGVK
jgi:hypothetical protein